MYDDFEINGREGIFAWLRLQRSSNVDLVFARNIFIDEMFVD